MAYWFWTILVAAVILWYVVVTIIVTVRGGKDVLDLVRDLKNNQSV